MWMYLLNNSRAQSFALLLVIVRNPCNSSFPFQREKEQGRCYHCGSQPFCGSLTCGKVLLFEFIVLHLAFPTCLRLLCQIPAMRSHEVLLKLLSNKITESHSSSHSSSPVVGPGMVDVPANVTCRSGSCSA